MTWQPYQHGPRSGYLMRSYTPNGYERALSTFPRSVWARQGMAGQMYLNADPAVPRQSHYSENLVRSPDAWTRAIAAGAAPPVHVPSSWGPYPLSDGAPAYAPGMRVPVMGATKPGGGGAVPTRDLVSLVVGVDRGIQQLVSAGLSPRDALERVLDGVASGDAGGTAYQRQQMETMLRRFYREVGFSRMSQYASDPSGNPATGAQLASIYNDVRDSGHEKARSGFPASYFVLAGAIGVYTIMRSLRRR